MSSSPVKKMDGATKEEPTLPPASVSASSLNGVGTKRPAPSLLPPFEPLSSSPGFPRPSKRQALDRPFDSNAFLRYPTPIPTSTTGILSSSPLRAEFSRPILARSSSANVLGRLPSSVLERAPLTTVPSIELKENGETVLMGRSSNSSHYQLSACRLISRVHVKARYIPASEPDESNKMEIVCCGWNGVKLHSQGRTWNLVKGEIFISETEGAEIMLDVQKARVMLYWPKRDRHDCLASLSDDESPRSRARRASVGLEVLQSSPLRMQTRIKSPESPSPAGRSSNHLNRQLLDSDASEAVEIYEDVSGDEQELPNHGPNADVSFAQTVISNDLSSELSDPEDDDPDEENDFVVHSFGPYGANLSNRLAAFQAESPQQPSRKQSGVTTTKPSAEPEEKVGSHVDVAAVRNHVVNQLAYSRLASNPLSTIMNNLPAEERSDLTKSQLRGIIEATPCVGIIARQGKDAAGKPLESEYYYVPEHDTDESRRLAVTDGLRKPSLRACRKSHKQYYWKRPKTP